jgi:hypothetical protein
MATTTPNFGWTVPTSSDLVKNGATAIETLGDSIDASLVDLKGGTTGQVLAKATNTDMDFSWTTPSAGATGLTYITGGTFTSASSIALSAGALTSTYKNYVVVFNVNSVSAGQNLLLQLNAGGAAQTGSNYYGASKTIGFSLDTTNRSNGTTSFRMGSTYDATYDNAALTLEIYNCGSSEYVGFAGQGFLYAAAAGEVGQTSFGGYYNTRITCDGFTITTSTGNVTGFYRVYGRNQS